MKKSTTFKELITTEKSVILRDRSLPVSVTEMFKVKKSISTITIGDTF